MNSLEYIPSQPDTYGPWAIWQPMQSGDGPGYEFARIDAEDRAVIAEAITASTERTYDGPKTTPGQIVLFIREPRDERVASTPSRFEYSVRAGFIGRKRPFNHIVLQIEAATDESLVTRIMTALVNAWEPEHLGVATDEVQMAQGHKPPEVVIGWLTYIKAGTAVDLSLIDHQVAVSSADGGTYITVPGTPANPSLDHIRQVRTALGYPDPE